MQLKEVYMDGVNSMYKNSAGKKKQFQILNW